MNIDPIDKLTAYFMRLPGVGKKTASRYAYNVLKLDEKVVEEFADAMVTAKKTVHHCRVCGHYTDGEVCSICETRDKSVILVVKEPKDVYAFERLKDYNGVYHVLHGTLDPMNGVGVNDLNIKSLLARLDGVKEVVMATNPDVEGEATAMYIASLLKPFDVKVSRLAHGIPIGQEIEFADEVTLSRALTERKDI